MSNEPKKQVQAALTNDAAKAVVMDEVKFILGKQKEKGATPSWGTKEHNATITRVAIACGLDEASKADFMACLLQMGLGGNASQFRQALVKEKMLPASPTVADVASEYV